MRPIQNSGGEETIRERSYPVAKATAITAGQVVQLSGGKVVPAAAAQTAAILGIAGEDHSGTADILNPRADGDEILVCDNPGLIFECPVPTIKAASGSAATLVPASGDIAAGAADDAYNAAVLTLETGGTPAAGDEYELYPALGSAVCALNAKATALVVSATGATAVRCIGHDYERHTIRCIAAAHMLAAKS